MNYHDRPMGVKPGKERLAAVALAVILLIPVGIVVIGFLVSYEII